MNEKLAEIEALKVQIAQLKESLNRRDTLNKEGIEVGIRALEERLRALEADAIINSSAAADVHMTEAELMYRQMPQSSEIRTKSSGGMNRLLIAAVIIIVLVLIFWWLSGGL